MVIFFQGMMLYSAYSSRDFTCWLPPSPHFLPSGFALQYTTKRVVSSDAFTVTATCRILPITLVI